MAMHLLAIIALLTALFTYFTIEPRHNRRWWKLAFWLLLLGVNGGALISYYL